MHLRLRHVIGVAGIKKTGSATTSIGTIWQGAFCPSSALQSLYANKLSRAELWRIATRLEECAILVGQYNADLA